jgi:sortase B
MKNVERILMVLCLAVLIACGWYLLEYARESHENKQTYRQVEDIAFPQDGGKTEDAGSGDADAGQADDFDYLALLAENADCIGWLTIPDTDISYPVVQGSDNEYYLKHDFYGKDASCGSLFLDCRNDASRDQEHLIIYGHQMKDGSMFKQLNGYKNEDFYEEHKELTLYLGTARYRYEVAAVYVTNVARSGEYYNFLHSETREQQMDYIKGMAACQLYDTGVTVQEADELLSLSTCEYSSTNGRLIVLARRIEGGNVYGDDYK